MFESPIQTVITNNRPVCRKLAWAADKGGLYIGASSSITVNYDVWTRANRNQRLCILSECRSGSTSLKIRVLGINGSWTEIQMCPENITKPGTETKQVVPAEKPVEPPAGIRRTGSIQVTRAIQKDEPEPEPEKNAADIPDKNFNKLAGASSGIMEGIGARRISFADAPVPADPIEKETPPAEEAAEASEAAEVVETAETVAESNDVAEAGVNKEEEIEALLAARKWDEALKALSELYPEAGFTRRSIMSLRKLAAIKHKYSLA